MVFRVEKGRQGAGGVNRSCWNPLDLVCEQFPICVDLFGHAISEIGNDNADDGGGDFQTFRLLN